MSDSVQPHRRQPMRFPRPWDSPGKDTGVDCHFLLQCMKVKSESEVTQSCLTLRDPMDCSLPGSSIHGIFQARVLEWGAIEPQEGCKLKTQGVDMEAPHPQPTGLHLVPTLQLALGGISAGQLKDPLTSAWRVSRRCGR